MASSGYLDNTPVRLLRTQGVRRVRSLRHPLPFPQALQRRCRRPGRALIADSVVFKFRALLLREFLSASTSQSAEHWPPTATIGRKQIAFSGDAARINLHPRVISSCRGCELDLPIHRRVLSEESNHERLVRHIVCYRNVTAAGPGIDS